MNYYMDGNDYIPGKNHPLLVRDYIPVMGFRALHTQWIVQYECPKCGKRFSTKNGDAVYNGKMIRTCPCC